ncbi:MAG: purine-binding chemotaxis protein CheW [Cyanobacteria bacterium SID2]|nr:purine-binding chemotaxis protein CheW [Cyanobacteria bacterium SID2]MBP0003222.1 purine-binding chemotaxis protein CheW [Cyanobacteria bacterium SBC]
MNIEPLSKSIDDCWNQIGVEGDRSCPELKTAIHCRNCPVYSVAGRGLLEREAPIDYLLDWTNVLEESHRNLSVADEAVAQAANTQSAIVFRVGGEWLALPAKVFQEVTQPCPIHTLPHRSNQLFLGLVSIRGEILMCISLSHLLGLALPSQALQSQRTMVSERMVVIAKGENKWVFRVDEVYGVHRFPPDRLQDTPVVVSKAAESYTIGTLDWHDRKVNYLDAELLFYTLNRRLL